MARRQQTSSKRLTHRRNEKAVRIFNLRDVDVPYLGGQQSDAQQKHSRSRRRAGKQAWITRVARYGPTGCPITQLPRLRKVIVIPMSQQTRNNGSLGYDETSHTQAKRRRIETPELTQDAPISPPENEPKTPVEASRSTKDYSGSADSDLPHFSPRMPLGETAMPDASDASDAPTPFASSPSSLQTGIAEMARFLDERRARLLGPQDLTRPRQIRDAQPPRPQSPRPVVEEAAILIFEDDEEEEGDDEVVDEDKENMKPD